MRASKIISSQQINGNILYGYISLSYNSTVSSKVEVYYYTLYILLLIAISLTNVSVLYLLQNADYELNIVYLFQNSARFLVDPTNCIGRCESMGADAV